MPDMNHPSGNAKARVFFALWPTDAEQRLLAGWQKPLLKLCGGRAMRTGTLHNTLVFIGDVEHFRLEALELAAQEASGKSFELCLDTAHYWGHNHIVYAAPSHVPTQLLQLVGILEQHLATHRFKFDQREYQPHVTLLRNARRTDAPKAGNPQPASGRAELTPPLPSMPPVCWQMKDFALVQSGQKNGLANYQVLARFPLT
ncbi:MAG TPA: RNA 2',3'-cyclic phosphodiesterase [Gallionella sp.]|nr:RNA 2',3'-cyclic phosphodiesterase [Gallionella sp.]